MIAQKQRASRSNRAPQSLELCALGGLEVRGIETAPGWRSRELLLLLLLKPEGWYPDGLANALYGEPLTSCLKSAVSRLRHELGIHISRPPYLLTEQISADFVRFEDHLAQGDFRKAMELYKGPLAPGSEAPGIVEHRVYLEETLKQTVLSSSDTWLLVELTRRFPDDLTVIERVLGRLPREHPSRPYLVTRCNHLKTEYNS